jgi:hypothetical protein
MNLRKPIVSETKPLYLRTQLGICSSLPSETSNHIAIPLSFPEAVRHGSVIPCFYRPSPRPATTSLSEGHTDVWSNRDFGGSEAKCGPRNRTDPLVAFGQYESILAPARYGCSHPTLRQRRLPLCVAVLRQRGLFPRRSDENNFTD